MSSLSISALIRWIKSKDLFIRPSAQIAGKWFLYEYYTEPGDDLINIKEDDLRKHNSYWELNFSEEGVFTQNSNLPVRFLNDTEFCRWKLSQNFLKLIHPENDKQKEEFQFAIVKKQLKLLKKDVTGRIIFFGFFYKKQING